jgi:TusA-related sulfurtransferase
MIELDTRGLYHPAPLEMAHQAFVKLQAPQILHMIHTREPAPLFEIVKNNGGRHWAYQDEEAIWHIFITRDPAVNLESCRV